MWIPDYVGFFICERASSRSGSEIEVSWLLSSFPFFFSQDLVQHDSSLTFSVVIDVTAYFFSFRLPFSYKKMLSKRFSLGVKETFVCQSECVTVIFFYPFLFVSF